MRQQFKLVHAEARRRAVDAVTASPDGYVVEVKPATRTTDQNRLLWALLTDVATQVEWYGQKLAPEDWKHIFSASLNQQRAVPGLEGGFVVLGQSTSRLTKREFSDLVDLIQAFGAERDVKFTTPEWRFAA
jgi:hypothetical protein